LLHGTHGLLDLKFHKLSFLATGVNDHPAQQVLFFHQPVDLFMVDDKTIGLQILTDFHVAGKDHELLREDKPNADHHTFIADEIPIRKPRVRRGLFASFAIKWMVIIRAVRKPTPCKQPGDPGLCFKELDAAALLSPVQ
jgi:hypothetical protein